jgi:hypothetical protein
MNKQNLRFIAEIIGALPELNPHQRAFWLSRPNRLEEILLTLKNFDLQFVDKVTISHRLFTEDFNLTEFLSQANIIEADPDVLAEVHQLKNQSFKFGGSSVNYSHTKIAATGIEVRNDLPEQHIFNECDSGDLSIVIALLRQSIMYGRSGGLSFNMTNAFIIKLPRGEMVIRILFLNQIWKVTIEPYRPNDTWEASTRVFHPYRSE